MIQWIKCHVFGKHKYHVEVERLSNKKIDMRLTCHHCNLEFGAKSKFMTLSTCVKKNGRVKHLTVIK